MSNKIKHPGWAIKANGEWVKYAHGVSWDDDPHFAATFLDENDAIDQTKKFEKEFPEVHFTVVEAWEPLIAELLYQNEKLKKVNKITPDHIFHIKWALEDALRSLEGD